MTRLENAICRHTAVHGPPLRSGAAAALAGSINGGVRSPAIPAPCKARAISEKTRKTTVGGRINHLSTLLGDREFSACCYSFTLSSSDMLLSNVRYRSEMTYNVFSGTLNPILTSLHFSNVRPSQPALRRIGLPEIGSVIWGTPSNVNGFRGLAALLHGTLVVGVSQTSRR